MHQPPKHLAANHQRSVLVGFVLGLVVGSAAALPSAGCGGYVVPLEASDVGQQRSAIYKGSVDTGHPAVGMLHSGGASACSATLIDKRTVLTAAHCVLSHSPPYTTLSPVQFFVGSFNGPMYPGISVGTHPNYNGGNKSDVAVVRLFKDVVGVTPMPLASQKPTVGESITLIGYGNTSATSGEFGTKRKTTNTIGSIATTVFSFFGTNGGTVCQGDSGGPTLAQRGNKETVIGVHSTSHSDCAKGGTDMRVDVYNPWITQQLSTSVYGSPCSQQSECLSKICLQSGTNSFCSQACDTKACPFGDKCVAISGASFNKACVPNSGVGPKGLGDSCVEALDCASQICVPVPNKGSFCGEQCDPQQGNCPQGFACVPAGQTAGSGICLANGGKQLGESCGDGFDCESLICVYVPDTGDLCSRNCDIHQDDCPADFVCAQTSSGQGLCAPKDIKEPPVPPEEPIVKKNLGELCSEHKECDSNLCVKVGDAKICLRWCDLGQQDCPQGYSCNVVAGHDRGACAPAAAPEPPAKAGLGQACEQHEQCESQLCVNGTNERQFCSQLCEPAAGCPSGFDCVSAGNGQHACNPSVAEPAPAAARPEAPTSGTPAVGGCALAPQPALPSALTLIVFLLAATRRFSSRAMR